MLAGLAIGYAATVRTVGEPLLVIVLICMLARRMGWRRIAATAVAGVVPIAGYMFWFHIHTGQYALDESTGTFLYSRVQQLLQLRGDEAAGRSAGALRLEAAVAGARTRRNTSGRTTPRSHS